MSSVISRIIMLSAVFYFACLVNVTISAEDPVKITIGYITQQMENPPNLSNLDVPPENEGIAGGEISIHDNNTTGRFVGQEFSLKSASFTAGDDAVKTLQSLVSQGINFIITDVSAPALLQMSDAVNGQNVLFFNATATDNRLRQADCRANIMHIAPSRAMYADALAQFLAKKRWRNWFLVRGTMARDQLFAGAIKQAAKKFGGKIVAEKKWEFGPDARRTAQAEVPAFTQEFDYDVLIVADEIGVFGEYLMYRTWQPRPVAGTQGLTPSTWHNTHEQWGSAQLQSRFFKRFKRRMRAKDYQVWAPVRAIGEAATRTNSADFAKMQTYLKSPDFELAGFKGVPLTFRDWNWQLRQPILLIQPTALVSVSPQEGFLHPVSTLDTMGQDKRETACKLN